MLRTTYRPAALLLAFSLSIAAPLSAIAGDDPLQSKPKVQPPPANTSAKLKQKAAAKPAAAPLVPLTEQEKALQLLNRFTFGPRPGDVDKVMKMGSDAWFEQQLNPASINDAALDKRLADYPSINLATADILNNMPTEQMVRAVQEGKKPYPPDPMLAGVYEVLVTKLDLEKKKNEESKIADKTVLTPEEQAAKDKAQKDQEDAQKKVDQTRALQVAEQLLGLPKNQRMITIMKTPVIDRITFVGNVPDPQKGQLIGEFTPRERELFQEMAGDPRGASNVLPQELMQAKLLRAILSERQLQEVMTDFWFNHFNVFIYKDSDKYYTPGYEREAIRAHALGKFRDLLMATATHPAMMIYLDNWLSIGPESQASPKPKPGQKNFAQRGLNENYGREVMELHTVGVNGGYSQADVTSLARILTGWTVDHPELGGGFVFDPKKHEPGTKKWFGQTVNEDGYNEGAHALAWLAAQPQTAHFISYKLAQRFLADEPPAPLVDRMAKTYLDSDGDIRQVLRTLYQSPEFNSQKCYRAKVKTPLEFVASSLRATGTDPVNPGALVGILNKMQQPLYQKLTPDGYAMTADHWMSSSALLDRLNFSLSLARNGIGNIKFDAPRLLAASLLARPALSPTSAHGSSSALHPLAISQTVSSPGQSGVDEALGLMEATLIGGQVPERTNAVIRKQLADAQSQNPLDASQTLGTITALILGSPEFQMR